jgi:hypothetical protein
MVDALAAGITAASVVLIPATPFGRVRRASFALDVRARRIRDLLQAALHRDDGAGGDALDRLPRESEVLAWEYYALLAFALCGMFFMARAST